jgi:hypothetical protein
MLYSRTANADVPPHNASKQKSSQKSKCTQTTLCFLIHHFHAYHGPFLACKHKARCRQKYKNTHAGMEVSRNGIFCFLSVKKKNRLLSRSQIYRYTQARDTMLSNTHHVHVYRAPFLAVRIFLIGRRDLEGTHIQWRGCEPQAHPNL